MTDPQRDSKSGPVTNDAGPATRLLQAARQGDEDASQRLISLLYDELRELARRELRREHGPVTLHATDLVHEMYLKLGGDVALASNRLHFFGLAARAMRQVLVDQARRRLADKRGSGAAHVTLEEYHASDGGPDPAELLELNDAMEQLDERQRHIVEMRFFAGVEETEIAKLLDISERTVRREWVRARARLNRAMYGDDRKTGDA